MPYNNTVVLNLCRFSTSLIKHEVSVPSPMRMEMAVKKLLIIFLFANSLHARFITIIFKISLKPENQQLSAIKAEVPTV